GCLQARAARRAHAGRHHLRSRHRLPAHRRRLHRADLRPARPGRAHTAGLRAVRPAGTDGSRRRRLHRAGADEPARRPPLHLPRPSGAADMTGTTTITPVATPAGRDHPAPDDQPYLAVQDLSVSFPTTDGVVAAVQNLSYSLALGRTLAIVGESGSGKSVSSMAIMGLHDPRGTRMSGSIRLGGQEIIGMSQEELRRRRGVAAAMIFQDPQSSLHPYFTIGHQLVEAYRAHHQVSTRAARERAVDMLGRVGIPSPRRRMGDYPHQFSGGMRQRVMIAMALINNPKLLIADEPTTALDV